MSVWKRLVVGLLAFALAASGTVSASASSDPGARYQDFVEQQAERSKTPGVAWAVVGPEGVEQQGTAGVDGNDSPVTARTPFLWGSVSKPVTAALVVKLAGQGTLDLDAPVVSYLPQFTTADPAGSQQITVRNLLDHTSGLPEGLSLIDRGGPDRTFDQLVDELAAVEPIAAPGQQHQYSGLNYVVLGALVEQATGRSFTDELTDQILAPAGMTTALADGTTAERVLPPGNRYLAGQPVGFDTPIDPATVPAGYLVGSVNDLAGFARINLSGQVLSEQERLELHGPSVTTGEDSSYGLGWRLWQLPGGDTPIVWHGGAAPGYSSAVVLLPEQDKAVVVLQNAYGPFQEAQLMDLPLGLAALVSGDEPVTNEVDQLYVVLLGVLTVAVLGLAVLAWIGTARLRRNRPGRRWAWIVRAGVTAALLGALAWLPTLFGAGLRQVPLWAPDVAALLFAGLVLGGVGLLIQLAGALRRPRSTASAATGRTRPGVGVLSS